MLRIALDRLEKVYTGESKMETVADVVSQLTDGEIRAVLDAPTDFAGDTVPEDWPRALRIEAKRLSGLQSAAEASEWRDLQDLRRLLMFDIVDALHRPLLAKVGVLFDALASRLPGGSIERRVAMRLQDLTNDLRVFQVDSALQAHRELEAVVPGSEKEVVDALVAHLATK